DTPKPIRVINPAIPDALAALIDRLLVKDPAGRFQTAAEVAELLNHSLTHSDDPALSIPSGEHAGGEIMGRLPQAAPRLSAAEPPQKKVRRRRTLRTRALVCVLLGVVVLAGVTYWWQNRQPAPDPLANGVRPEETGPPTDFTNSLGMKFKIIPAGKFTM